MQKFCTLCLTILLFAACSKNTSIETGGGNNNNNNGGNNSGGTGGNNGGNNTNYYIKFTIDGASKNFTATPQALMTNAFGATILSFIAGSGGLEGINLTINNQPSLNPIKAGTYSETDILEFATAGVYNPGSTSEVYAAGVAPNPANPLKIVISSIDDKTVSGTFSGDFLHVVTASQQIGPDKKVVSNGQFYLPISKQ